MTWRERLSLGLPLLPIEGGADGTIGVDEPATIDKVVDTEDLGGAPAKHRERVQIAGSILAEIARVINANPAGTEYALVIRSVRGFDAATPEFTDPIDRALRDMGKIDIAAFDAALPTGTNEIGGVRIRGQFDDVAPGVPAEDAFADLRLTSARALHVSVRDAIPAGANNIGDVDVLTQPARSHATDSIRIGDGTDLVLVTAAGALVVDGSAVTQPVSGTVTANQGTAGTGGWETQGDAAHNAVLVGNPVRIGGRAQASAIAAVTDGVTVDLVADRHGNLRTRVGHEAPAASVFTNLNFPAANTRASSTRAAGAAGVRHVLTGLTAVLAAGATAPTAVQLDVRVRDGVLDTGTILWQMVISLPATAGAMNGITRSNLWIPGTAATAMTIEFSAAGGANTFESVSMEIVDITE